MGLHAEIHHGRVILKYIFDYFVQVVYDDVYMLDDDMKWKVLPPMPKPDSHIEFAWVIVNNSIVIVGGTTDKHPVTKKMTLVGEILKFQLDTQVLSSCLVKNI